MVVLSAGAACSPVVSARGDLLPMQRRQSTGLPWYMNFHVCTTHSFPDTRLRTAFTATRSRTIRTTPGCIIIDQYNYHHPLPSSQKLSCERRNGTRLFEPDNRCSHWRHSPFYERNRRLRHR